MNVEQHPLWNYCKSDAQRKTLKAYLECGEHGRNTAKKLGITHQTVSATIKRIKYVASSKGYAPEHDWNEPVPDGFFVKGRSDFYQDGQLKHGWVKSQADAERQAELRNEFYAGLAKELKPLPPIKCAKRSGDDILNFIPIADPHFNLRTHIEAGAEEDWDLEKAEQVITAAYFRMLESMPDSRQCLIAVLGDYFHANGKSGTTPKSGHVLDISSHHQKAIEVGTRCLRRIIERAAETHQNVHLMVIEGNHDPDMSSFMRVMFDQLYSKNKRIHVNMDCSHFQSFRGGDNFIGMSHGDTKSATKPNELALVFADMDGYSESQFREIHTAHRHSYAVIPFHAGRVIQHATMIPRDNYAASHGYKNLREAVGRPYHKTYGPCNDHIERPLPVS